MDHFISKVGPSDKLADALEYSVMFSVLLVVVVATLRILGVIAH